MKTTSKVLIRANNYIAVESNGKLYILRFNDTTDTKESMLEEAKSILKFGLLKIFKDDEIKEIQHESVQLKLDI